jgi:transposase
MERNAASTSLISSGHRASVEGVEPTNNAAEHRVRHGVMWRKTSFGTDSPNGSRFVERILTVVTTLRMQGRNVLDYVTTACEAAVSGHAPPSLLPSTCSNRCWTLHRRSSR